MRSERGSITPLVVGFALVAALLVAVVVDASAAFLARQRLDSIADAAALAATEGLAGDAAYNGDGDGAGRVRIDPAAATRYVAASIARDDDGAGIDFDVRVHERMVEVDVRVPLRLPIPVPGISGSVVTGHAAAVVEVRR